MNTPVPMNDFAKEYEIFRPALLPRLDTFLKHGQYILGENVQLFEKHLAEFIGTKYCVGVGNGLEALQISLLALGIKRGDEIITVANSDVATALAIVHTGATPVFVDIDEYFHMNPDLIERAITKKTKAILPVHLYGQTADMDRVMSVAKTHKLFVVEDACQAHGATYKNKNAGSFGDAGCFSFYPTKNLGAYGDGGAITTNSFEIYDRCRMLRNRGQKNRYIHQIRGLNSRLDEIQAVILLQKLAYLDKFNRKRRKIAALYYRALQDTAGVRLPLIRPKAVSAFHLFVVQTHHRDQLQRYLWQHNVESRIHYPISIHKQESFSEFREVQLPETERVAKQILSLPMNPLITQEQVERVCDLIGSFSNI